VFALFLNKVYTAEHWVLYYAPASIIK